MALGASGTVVVGVAGVLVLDVDFLDLCFDFESFDSLVDVGVAVPELGGEGVCVFNCGANALASTLAISRSSQVSFMPSLNFFSSFMTKTSSRRRTPSMTAALSSSLRRISPFPSALPVDKQRILRWLFRAGDVRDWRAGEKNMDSSSGCAMRRMMRLLLRREGGGGGASMDERCQRRKKRRGVVTRRIRKVVAIVAACAWRTVGIGLGAKEY